MWRQWLVTERARTQWKRYKGMLDDAKDVNDASATKMAHPKESGTVSGISPQSMPFSIYKLLNT